MLWLILHLYRNHSRLSLRRTHGPSVVWCGGGRTDWPRKGAADGRTDQNAEVNRRTDGPVRGLPRAPAGKHAHKAHSRSCCHLPATEQKLIVGVYGILYLSKNHKVRKSYGKKSRKLVESDMSEDKVIKNFLAYVAV